MSNRPVIERSAQLHAVVPWASVWHCKRVADFVRCQLVESRNKVVNFIVNVVVFDFAVCCSKVNFLENLTFLFGSEYLLYDADWFVVAWAPWLEFLLEFLDNSEVVVLLALQSEELT